MISHSRFARNLALAALAVAGGALSASEPKWTFAVFGDTRGNSSTMPVNTTNFAEVASAVAAFRPDFVLFGGDFALSPDSAALALWANAAAPLYEAGIPIYPVIGNHDLGNDVGLASLFGAGIPTNGPVGEVGTTYALQHKNALVLALNVYAGTNVDRVNQAWVDAVLATNPLPHVFASGHVPAFKFMHMDCLGSFPTERDIFWNSLSNAHTRLYFCSHDHCYDHVRLDDGDGNPDNDLHQMIVATGGAPLYTDDAFNGTNGIWTPVRVFHESQFGFVLVEVNDDQVRTTWYHRVGPGDFVPGGDVFTYSLGPRPVLTAGFIGGNWVLTWKSPAVLQASPDPKGPFVDVPGAASPYGVTMTDGGGRFYRLALPW